MNEEIKNKMFEYFQAMEVAVKNTKDFAQDQIPEVVKEYITWYFWDHAISSVIYGLVICCIITLCRWVYKDRNHEDWGSGNEPVPYLICFLLAAVMFVVLFAGFIPNVKESIKASVAPRVVVIEWVADNIRSQNIINQ